METLTDPRPLLVHALDVTEGVITSVAPPDLERPTPCEGWTVRDLLGHLVAVTHRVAHIAGGGHPYDLPSMLTGPDEEWSAAWRSGRAGLLAAWADDAVLSRTVIHPAGKMPGAQAAFVYVQEFTTHAGDLATATGRTDLLDDELAEGVLAASVEFLPAQPRGGPIPFGPVVEVPADAPAHVRLAAWLGRG